ncbi:MAG: threonylcarbamoyl-AMP synthase [Burkholderiales bacterium]|jgi:L-threonylcarbamoyladenylate synthase|nr:threonylcarbamoyl-AMP synthase [Burkholderiales bacterium]
MPENHHALNPPFVEKARIRPADEKNIVSAAELLSAGKLVAFPTETVYGLGADAANSDAVARVYDVKQRPVDHPLIVHVADQSDMAFWARDIPEQAWRLVRRFTPGPLTLILPRANHVRDAVTGGQDTIGLRIPSHPVAQRLLTAFAERGGRGVAAPSANRFGHVSPTSAQHVADDFGEKVDLILDGGAAIYGIESTVIAFVDRPLLLRPGSLSLASIEEELGETLAFPAGQPAPRASGTLASHYAPDTPTVLVSSREFEEKLAAFSAQGMRVATLAHTMISSSRHALRLPATPAEYAHHLYAALRTLDAAGADLILIENVPDSASWLAVRDRLTRATTPAP